MTLGLLLEELGGAREGAARPDPPQENVDFPVRLLPHLLSGFGVRVYAFGSRNRVSGYGFRGAGFGFMVSVFGIRDSGFGFMVSVFGFGFREVGGCMVWGVGCGEVPRGPWWPCGPRRCRGC